MKKPRSLYEDKLYHLQGQLKAIDQKAKNLSHLNAKDEVLGPLVRIQQRQVQEEEIRVRGALNRLREGFILGVHHPMAQRAYKELPHFFKFCLFKNKPQRTQVKDNEGEYIRPIKEIIDFRGIHAEVTYFRGELGDQDRMVYLAVMNEAIRHKEFVWEFGQIPFSTDELADKAGFSEASHRRKEVVLESLQRLVSTQITFRAGLSPRSPLRGTFHLVENVFSFGKTQLQEDVEAQLRALEQNPKIKPPSHRQDPNLMDYNERLELLERDPGHVITYLERLGEQARALLEKFKPRTPSLTLVKFNAPLMQAINGHEITTFDMWTLARLTRNSARALFLFLYDISQWRTSKEPLCVPLRELLQLMDLHPDIDSQNGKEYLRWNRTRERVEEILREVNQLAKYVDQYEWLGEGEESILQLQLSDSVLQIPSR